MNVVDVIVWLVRVQLAELVELFAQRRIDGPALFKLGAAQSEALISDPILLKKFRVARLMLFVDRVVFV
jgi:hypothetical protein